jgi:hypothetical protein
MTRRSVGRWERTGARAVYESTGPSGPATVVLRVAYGIRARFGVDRRIEREEADTTSLSDGRVAYTFVDSENAAPAAHALWTEGNFVVGVNVRGGERANHSRRTAKRILSTHIPPERLPDVQKTARPEAASFEAPDGYDAITGQYADNFPSNDAEARISVAYPTSWTALHAQRLLPFAKVLDISRRRATARKRWGQDLQNSTEAATLHAPDAVRIQVAGPPMVHSRRIGDIDPIDGIQPGEVRAQAQGATVVQPPTDTTIGGRAAATMAVEGTSTDGYAIQVRRTCIQSNGAVPCVTITRRARGDAAPLDTIRTIVQSVTAEVIRPER